MYDLEVLKEIALDLYVPVVIREHGPAAGNALRNIMAALHTIYRYVAPEVYTSQIVVFQSLATDEDIIDGLPTAVADPSLLPHLIDGPCVLEVSISGQLLVRNNLEPNIAELAQKAVVYVYNDGSERFVAKHSERVVRKLSPEISSMFSIPTFSDLHDALENYKIRMARYSSCKILSGVWIDEDRIFLRNAQESVMRNSLVNFLKSRLRGDVEVRPEQVVDESHPVDIKVTWSLSNRLALIEIKWMGTPKFEDGHLGNAYGDARARDGAKQLADYLDKNVVQAPTHIAIGYLVVIDARRAALSSDTTSISKTHGMHYADQEIEFDPSYHEIRTDFAKPVRMFVEPICR